MPRLHLSAFFQHNLEIVEGRRSAYFVSRNSTYEAEAEAEDSNITTDAENRVHSMNDAWTYGRFPISDKKNSQEINQKIVSYSEGQTTKKIRISAFRPPKSPHRLIEEDLSHDPWALLVATIFLNKTSATAARPHLFRFLQDNPDPFAVVRQNLDQLLPYFSALGLQRTRTLQVWRMSYDFLYKQWTDVDELYGMGRYARDAFRIFCLGIFSVEPQDRYLKVYWAWYNVQERAERLKEMNC